MHELLCFLKTDFSWSKLTEFQQWATYLVGKRPTVILVRVHREVKSPEVIHNDRVIFSCPPRRSVMGVFGCVEACLPGLRRGRGKLWFSPGELLSKLTPARYYPWQKSKPHPMDRIHEGTAELWQEMRDKSNRQNKTTVRSCSLFANEGDLDLISTNKMGCIRSWNDLRILVGS